MAGLELGDPLGHVVPDIGHLAARVGNAVRPQAHHPLEVVHIGHRRVVARLAAGYQAALFAHVAQQFHFPVTAITAGHGMIGVIALTPGRSRRSIDEYNISVDDLDKTDILNSEFERKVSEKLKIELGILKPKNIGESDSEELKKISAEQNRETTFLFFLENGYLPWYGKEEYIKEFTKNSNWKTSLNDEHFRLKLKRILKSEDSVIERFVLQFPIKNVLSFLEKSNHLFAGNRKQFMKIFGVLKDNLRISFLRFLVKVSLFVPPVPPNVKIPLAEERIEPFEVVKTPEAERVVKAPLAGVVEPIFPGASQVLPANFFASKAAGTAPNFFRGEKTSSKVPSHPGSY